MIATFIIGFICGAIETQYVEDSYEILYKVTYDNGKTREIWKEVEKEEYDEYEKEKQ